MIGLLEYWAPSAAICIRGAGKGRMSFIIKDLKDDLGIFVVSELQNSRPQLLANEEHSSDTCRRGNVLWFNIR